MAVVTLNKTTFTLVTNAAAGTLVDFRGTGAVQVSQTATPAANDFIIFAGNDLIRFPEGTPVYARAPDGDVIAVTRPF